MRQLTRTAESVPDCQPAFFQEPGRLLRIREITPGALETVSIGQERLEVSGRVSVREGLDERGGTEALEHVGVRLGRAAKLEGHAFGLP